MYSVELLITVLLILTLFLTRKQILRKAGQWLVIESGPPPSLDAIVLLNGNISTRPYLVAEIYKKHPCQVLMARISDTQEVRVGLVPNISETSIQLLVKLGVPREHITFIESDRWIGGTSDEALLSCHVILDKAYQDVMIVTDAFHTRRSRWTFRRMVQNHNVRFYCASTRLSLSIVDKWWHSEFGLIMVVTEYLKWIHSFQKLGFLRRKNVTENQLPPASKIRLAICGKRPLDDD